MLTALESLTSLVMTEAILSTVTNKDLNAVQQINVYHVYALLSVTFFHRNRSSSGH